jgi:hypothetical protein
MRKAAPTPLPPSALDQVSGGAAVNGSMGNDRIATGNGTDDLVHGLSGSDVIITGTGSDTVHGGGGNDTINAGIFDGGDSDLIHGGDGNDVVVWAPHSGDDTIHGGSGLDTVEIRMPAMMPGFPEAPGQPAPYVTWDMDAFLRAMSVDGALMTVRHVEGNMVSFTDRAGNPVAVSGTFTTPGGTLTFEGVESFRFVWAHEAPRY